MFFSSPANLLLPGPARLRDIVVDTSHFLGNAPAQAQISGASIDPAHEPRMWTPLVARRPVLPDTPHRFRVGPDAPAGGRGAAGQRSATGLGERGADRLHTTLTRPLVAGSRNAFVAVLRLRG